jgi:hypothetical protein
MLVSYGLVMRVETSEGLAYGITPPGRLMAMPRG